MKKLAILLITAVIITGCVPQGFGQKVSFKKPDIKDDFCGVHINFQYCKCAFHNEYCDAVGMNKSQANSYVKSEFDKWLTEQLTAFEENCLEHGGFFKKDTCQYCESGYYAQNNDCVSSEDNSKTADQNTEFKPDGPLNNDCGIKQEEFDRDWKKYSDIDDVIPFEERSYEAKQTVTTYDTMIDLMLKGFELEEAIALENQLQTELEDYRQALVQNIKTNLLKSFWRLSWITYSTIQSGKSAGESYSQLLTSGAGVETIGAGLKTIQSVIPADSTLAIDTSSLSGKAKSIGAATALEAIDSLGDPVKIVTEFTKSVANAPLPSADLTPEEINILKDQHLTKGVIDSILAESRQANEVRQTQLAEIENKITELQEEINRWENEEKVRVAQSLEESCKNLKNKFEEQN